MNHLPLPEEELQAMCINLLLAKIDYTHVKQRTNLSHYKKVIQFADMRKIDWAFLKDMSEEEINNLKYQKRFQFEYLIDIFQKMFKR